MIKIEIKSIWGSVLFAYEKEGNTVKQTLEHAVLTDADLRDADLRGAVLRDADLRGAVLRGADLTDADLRGADLRGAVLSPIKNDMFAVLLYAIPEVVNFKKALVEGRIDGSTYEGKCACLCGTLMKSTNTKIASAINMEKNISRPIERFFLGIKKGDTPQTNQLSKIALQWTEEFESLVAVAATLLSPEMNNCD